MIEFYTNPMSRGQIVHWMLEELGQPYATHWLSWGPAGNKGAAYLAINPMGKVPAIRHDGKVVTEAAAICLYLADVFPQSGLKPGPEDLADYYRFILFAAGPVEQAVTSRAMGWTVPEGRDSMAGFGTYDATIDALEAMLKGRAFVCGDRFTAADVYFWEPDRLGPHLRFDPQARGLRSLRSAAAGPAGLRLRQGDQQRKDGRDADARLRLTRRKRRGPGISA